MSEQLRSLAQLLSDFADSPHANVTAQELRNLAYSSVLAETGGDPKTVATVLSAAAAAAAATYAPKASPALTGTPLAPTAAPGTSTTQIATTSFVVTSFAPLASPALTGNPTVPTQAALTNSTRAASTAYADAADAAVVATLAADYKVLTISPAALRHSIEFLYDAYDVGAHEFRVVGYFDHASNHWLSINGGASSYFNFQGGGTTLMTLAFEVEYRPTNSEEGGTGWINGTGLFAKGVNGTANNHVFAIGHAATSGIDIYIYTGASTNLAPRFNNNAANLTLVNGKRYQFVIQYNGAKAGGAGGGTNNDVLKVWVNGSQLTFYDSGSGCRPGGTDLPQVFQNPSGSSNQFYFGKNFANTSTTYNFDGRCWNILTAASLPDGATLATQLHNAGLSLTKTQIQALGYTLGTFWPLDEVSTDANLVAVDYSGNGRHLTRNNSIQFKQQVVSYTDRFSGAVFYAGVNAASGFTRKTEYEPDWEPNGTGLPSGMPGLRCRRGRGLYANVPKIGAHTTGHYFEHVCLNATTTETFWFGVGDPWSPANGGGNGDMNGNAVYFGCEPPGTLGDSNSAGYVRFDGGDLVAAFGSSYPNGYLNLSTSGNGSGLKNGNTSITIGTHFKQHISSVDVSSSGTGTTVGPYRWRINKNNAGWVAQTPYVGDSGSGVNMAHGWLTLIPNKKAVFLGGDTQADATINLSMLVAPVLSTNDQTALEAWVDSSDRQPLG